MNAQLKKGLLDICILSELERKESYGYAIINDLAPLIEISESTLYPILKRLLAKGAITSQSRIHNNRVRKYYQITDIGKAEVNTFINEWGQVERIFQFIKGENYDG
ncbi:PadR family transcriptional regulator [Companilactobacillus nuruki]|uniref:PadR family transcriptional regulator n=1 Tax=Companilactobacillus nuruki TaxID=1993540 RepID=A0A2N7AR55_9LACO|nr:PadR family transcriptional regulator [Companilactobacillus nuruki]PMD67828.1 PadR family transcriptional regulator [Companilactobacillus nuruki]